MEFWCLPTGWNLDPRDTLNHTYYREIDEKCKIFYWENLHGRNAFELDDVIDEQEESGRDPFCSLQSKEIGKKLVAAIDDLTPDHRAVIVMRAVEGLSYKDISRILGCSEGTVMSRLHYARKKLQEKLG